MGRFIGRPFDHPLQLVGVAALVLVVGGLLGGCGRGSFVGRQYDNFTAYYNTFYNAQAAFEKGLQSIDQSTPEVDRNRYISIFPAAQSESGGQAFDDAIQKSANLLREHPNSKWVDDALLLIGRSYYFQQNYVGAAEKYREVIALDAERVGEAQFRLAQTLLAAERYADASEVLTGALEGEESYGTWTARMHLVRGELLVRQEQWEQAETSLEQGLDGSLPNEVGARAALLLGQVRETREDYEGARTAYQRVSDYNPRYPLEFAGRLSAIEMQGLHGEPGVALQRLESLERGDDTNEMRGKMAIVRARLYEVQGESERARRVLLDMLRRDEAPTGATQGGLHYELGTLYRDAFEDFTEAAAHFDTASTSLSSGGEAGRSGVQRQSRTLPRAPTDAATQAERFRGLAERAQTVTRLDSLLRLGHMEPDEFQSFIKKVRKRRLEERQAQAEAREERQQQFQAQGTAQNDPSSRSQNDAVETRGSDSGFLFHRDPTLVQRGRRQFRQTWGDRPRVDNWRRLSDIRGGADTVAGEGEEAEALAQNASGSQQASGPVVDVSAVPRDSASQAEMEGQRAVARYELANSLFRAASRPDSAETWYKKVLAENDEDPITQQALYALAQSHLAQGDTALAHKTYRRVIEEYSGTSFARRSREQLGLEREEPSAELSASKADSAYAQAYNTWQSEGAHRSALGAFFDVAETYPDTDAAPRALLAAGVVYHQAVQRDSASAPRWQVESALDRLAPSDSSVNREFQSPSDSVTADPSVPDSAAVDSMRANPAVGDSVTTPPNETPTADSAAADTTTDVQSPSAPATPQDRDTTQRPRRPELRADSTTLTPDSAHTPTPDSGQGPSPRPRSQGVHEDSITATESGQPSQTPGASGESLVPLDSVPSGVHLPSFGSDTTSAQSPWPSADSVALSVYLWPDSSWTGPSVRNPIAPLRQLLSHITAQYPDAPEAERAQLLLDRLPSSTNSDSAATDSAAVKPNRAPAAPDSAATPPQDSTALSDTTRSDTTAATDSTTRIRPRRADTSRVDTTRRDRGARQSVPRRDSAASAGSDSAAVPADSASREWTLLVQTFEIKEEAAQRRQRVQKQLSGQWSVSVYADTTGSPPQFHVIVGTFSSEADAVRAKTQVATPLSDVPTVWALPVREEAQD